ncbi:MAG TPA: cupredoxin domain-containing protein [Dehalococcoidia bacterium]|nr:cupredoxin domain-containing protein [Dehalococcoidia bacterium]
MPADPTRRCCAVIATAAACLLLGACKASNNHPAATATVSPTRAPAARTAAAVPSTTVVARPGTPGQIVLSAGGAAPDTVTVQAGRAVTFVNSDTVPHHPVSVEANLFDAGQIAPGASAQVTVTAAGLHDWHDAVNPRLSGTIRVVP